MKRTRLWHWAMLFGAAAALPVIGAGSSAHGASDAACVTDGYTSLTDPLVTVVEGPGGTLEEQAGWGEALQWHSFLHGLEISLSRQTFRLERTP